MSQNNPFAIFTPWYTHAEATESCGNAMVLATASQNAIPSARVVLLAEFSEANGFVFYTDYTSQKGQEIAANPKVALLFYWPKAYQQVRIEGVAQKTSAAMSDQYFYNRAREKQLSATLSQQSQRLNSPEQLTNRYFANLDNLAAMNIVRPETWGGYTVQPSKFEFWTGSEVRLHKRQVFEKDAQQVWQEYYLQP